MSRREAWTWGGLLVLPLLAACASATGPTPEPVCTSPGATPLSGGSCVVVAAAVAQHERGDEIVTWIADAFDPIRTALGLSPVEIRLRGGAARVIPEVGVGGYASDRGLELQVDLDTRFDHEFQREWVEQILAHELHHVARLRAVGNPRSVGALVTFEGMADQFAEDFGGQRPSPWSTALHGSELDAWVHRVLSEHPLRDYDVNAWLFGTTPEIPRWAGYSAGYAIAGAYLAVTGTTAADAADVDADRIIDAVRNAR